MIKNLFKSCRPMYFCLLLTLFWFSAQAQITGFPQISSGGSKNFSVPPVAGATYVWSATGGVEITATLLNNATVKKNGSLPGTVYVAVYGPGVMYCDSYPVSYLPPPTCVIGNGVINDLLCVTNSHPYWRLQMEGFEGQNVTYEWTAQHFNIMSGQGTTYIIGNPTDNGYGFTLYCKVTKTCTNGLKASKTFYYQSNSTRSCEQGVTGIYTGGGGIDLEAMAKVQTVNNENVDLIQAYPNPFDNEVKLKYFVAKETDHTSILIYNSFGQIVLNPVKEGGRNIGFNEVIVNGSDLKQGGLYFVSLFVNGELIKTCKIHFKK